MFIDSLDSGGLVGAGSTLDKNRTNSDEAALKQLHLLTNQISSKTLNNTQARRDLADLELVYQNLAGNDSGLNTLMRTAEEKEASNNESKDDSSTHNSDGIGMQTIRAIRNELENRELQSILKEIELQTKSNAIRPTRQNDNQKRRSEANQYGKRGAAEYDVDYEDESEMGAWPPKKYEHIKGTGYGTSWSPASFKKRQENFNKHRGSLSNRSTSRSKSETRLINIRNVGQKTLNFDLSKNDSVYFSSKGSLHGPSMTEEKYFAQISDLKSRLIPFFVCFLNN